MGNHDEKCSSSGRQSKQQKTQARKPGFILCVRLGLLSLAILQARPSSLMDVDILNLRHAATTTASEQAQAAHAQKHQRSGLGNGGGGGGVKINLNIAITGVHGEVIQVALV